MNKYAVVCSAILCVLLLYGDFTSLKAIPNKVMIKSIPDSEDI